MPFEYNPGELGADQVEIEVESCGICHSDLSMLENAWGMTKYPFVPGHEVIGMITEVGRSVRHLLPGQRVGLGWQSGSCMICEWCLGGNQNLCPFSQGTIVGRHGGFADRVRAQQTFVFPLPAALDSSTSGPLFCGGVTVFNPLLQFGVKPTDRVGVIGIGGLGHLALQFLQAWGCEVTAFTTSPDKAAEARVFGAHQIIDSRSSDALKRAAGSFDFILNTANADLDWSAYLATLRPKGRLHMVGAAPGPVSASIFSLIGGQKSISGSPIGSPTTITAMLDFAVRHQIEPVTETFSFEQVNEAMERLRSGKARYRIVLKRE